MAIETYANYPFTTAAGSSGTTAPVTGTVETWTVASSTSFPAASTTLGTQFHIADPAQPTEVILVTNVSGTTWTVTRGAESTTPVAHATGATFRQVVTAGVLRTFPQVQYLTPTGDTTGAADLANFNTAVGNLPNGGVIVLAPATFYTNAAWTLPAQTTSGSSGGGPVCLQGSGPATVLRPVGAAITGISYHRTANYAGQYGLSAQPDTGYIRDITIDGTNATGASIGLDFGDGWGYDIRVNVANFTGAGAIGINEINRIFWTEKAHVIVNIQNCTNSYIIDTVNGTADRSHEYGYREMYLFCNSTASVTNAQTGITIRNGAYVAGSSFIVKGNFEDANAAGTPAGPVFTLSGQDGSGNYSVMNHCHLDVSVEANNGRAVGCVPFSFGSANNTVGGSGGVLNFQFSTWANSNPSQGQFQFEGPMSGDTSLFTVSTPAVPASGTAFTNNQNSSMVYISGGTVTQINVANINTGRTSGAFYIPMNRSITLTYSVAPTWVWIAAH